MGKEEAFRSEGEWWVGKGREKEGDFEVSNTSKDGRRVNQRDRERKREGYLLLLFCQFPYLQGSHVRRVRQRE